LHSPRKFFTNFTEILFADAHWPSRHYGAKYIQTLNIQDDGQPSFWKWKIAI